MQNRYVDILLVTSPPWGIDNPPVGLAYLATYLGTNGILAGIFDINIAIYRRINQKFHKLWLPEYKNWWSHPHLYEELSVQFKKEIQWAVERILDSAAPVIGFSVVDPKEKFTIEIIQKIRKKDRSKKYILGGPAVSTPEQRKIFTRHLGNAVDFYVQSEGEKILLKIMKNYKEKSIASLKKIAGTPPIVKEIISDLHEIPFPTYDEFDFSMYQGRSLIVEWSRGCVSTCAFCKGRLVQDNYRMKTARKIVDEIEFHYHRHHISYFVVCDNLINGNINELERVCDLLIEKKLPVQWEGQAIPFKKMTQALLAKMKSAGCAKLQWGLESGSDTVLKNIRKGWIFRVDEAENVIRFSHMAGIQTEVFIIIGLPGEDENEFNKTKKFIIRNRDYIDLIKSINTLHLVHGTDLFENALNYGLIIPDKRGYYLWYAIDGSNSYDIRVSRVKVLLEIAQDMGINVQEHNLFEGKEKDLVL